MIGSTTKKNANTMAGSKKRKLASIGLKRYFILCFFALIMSMIKTPKNIRTKATNINMALKIKSMALIYIRLVQIVNWLFVD